MAKKVRNWLTKEVVVTPKGNYTIPSFPTAMNLLEIAQHPLGKNIKGM